MPASFEPGQAIHIYRILKMLGAGGMGAVYEAIQDPIGRRVALKILHAQYAGDPAVMNRFFNEARAVNIIAHPGLVQVSDFGRTADGTAYLVMELLNGDTLAARIKQRRRLPAAEALQILQQLTSALAAAHTHGIVHRDLKPSNVMLVPHPAVPSGEQVKIVDFGIAKLLDENMQQHGGGLRTETGKLLGTPQYMAPEQAKTSKVDGQADVYAVGAMAYEMLSGQMPYQMKPDELVWALLARKLYDPPPDLATVEPTIPTEIARLVMSLLAHEPAQRPTMAQLDSMLCRLLGFDPARRSGMHAMVDGQGPATVSGMATVDAPAEALLTPSRSPTIDEQPGAPPPNLPAPPPASSGSAPKPADGVVANEMQAISTAPVRSSGPAAIAPVPAATPASSAPTRRVRWIVGIIALVVFEAVGVAVYLMPSRPSGRDAGADGHENSGPGKTPLASPPDLAAAVDLARLTDLAPPTTPQPPTDAKPKDQPHPRTVHQAHCAAATVTEACIHGKNIGRELRSKVISALQDSKVRLCAGERLVVGTGENGVRLVEAPDRLPGRVLNDFRLILGGYLDVNPRSGEIDILCSAPVR